MVFQIKIVKQKCACVYVATRQLILDRVIEEVRGNICEVDVSQCIGHWTCNWF